jgi:hypothetical protein
LVFLAVQGNPPAEAEERPVEEVACDGAWLRGEAFLDRFGPDAVSILEAACHAAVKKVATYPECGAVDIATIAIASTPTRIITLVDCYNGPRFEVVD